MNEVENTVHSADKVARIDVEKPSFLQLVKTLEDGGLDADLTQELVDLVHNMRAFALATGAKPKAKITLSLEVKLDGGIFEVVPSYTVKPPKKPRSRSIYYPTKDNGLSVNNQAQGHLPFGKDVTSRSPLTIPRA